AAAPRIHGANDPRVSAPTWGAADRASGAPHPAHVGAVPTHDSAKASEPNPISGPAAAPHLHGGSTPPDSAPPPGPRAGASGPPHPAPGGAVPPHDPGDSPGANPISGPAAAPRIHGGSTPRDSAPRWGSADGASGAPHPAHVGAVPTHDSAESPGANPISD